MAAGRAATPLLVGGAPWALGFPSPGSSECVLGLAWLGRGGGLQKEKLGVLAVPLQGRISRLVSRARGPLASCRWAPGWTGLDYLRSREHSPGHSSAWVARAVAINGTCILVKVFPSQPAWWGERKLVVKLINGRGGGGGHRQRRGLLGDLLARAQHRAGVYEHGYRTYSRMPYAFQLE